ncbi:MAG: DUF188 domain-containing protein [Spirochaetia bacterium]
MKIYVDADSCPARVREIIAERCHFLNIQVEFIANREVPVNNYPEVLFHLVPQGDGAADCYILENAEPGELVVTRDIPLAAELVKRSVLVINDRGTEFTKDNVYTRLEQRNFMQLLREGGIVKNRGKSFGIKEIKRFSDTFDSLLTRLGF